MPPDALALTDLTVRHGDVLAVDGLDLHIGRGETVALLGPNGAGKSTTVSAVLGLLHPDAGTVRVLGRAPSDAVRAGCVGAMLQHGGLPGEARVGEVLHLVRRSYGRAGRAMAWPLDDLAATTGIGGLLGRDVDALSGGQRQRVLLALALAGQPPLLLLDEPTSAMDVEGRRAFWTTMRDLAGRGTTVVFATHHLEEADAVADRVVVLFFFTQVFAGTPGGVSPEQAAATMVAMMAYGAIGAALGATVRLSFDRASGWSRQLRVTPVPQTSVVAVDVAVGMLLTLPPLVVVALTGRFVNGVRLEAGGSAGLVGVLWLGSAVFVALGLLLGWALEEKAAGGAIGIVGTVLAALGGLWVPVELFPSGLRAVAHGLPSYWYAETGRAAAGGELPPVPAVAALVGFAALFGVLAVLVARRRPLTAVAG